MFETMLTATITLIIKPIIAIIIITIITEYISSFLICFLVVTFRITPAYHDRSTFSIKYAYYIQISRYHVQILHRDGVVSISTRYGLDGPGIESGWG